MDESYLDETYLITIGMTRNTHQRFVYPLLEASPQLWISTSLYVRTELFTELSIVDRRQQARRRAGSGGKRECRDREPDGGGEAGLI